MFRYLKTCACVFSLPPPIGKLGVDNKLIYSNFGNNHICGDSNNLNTCEPLFSVYMDGACT